MSDENEIQPMTTRQFWDRVMEETDASDDRPVAVSITGVGVGMVTWIKAHNGQLWIDVTLDPGHKGEAP